MIDQKVKVQRTVAGPRIVKSLALVVIAALTQVRCESSQPRTIRDGSGKVVVIEDRPVTFQTSDPATEIAIVNNRTPRVRGCEQKSSVLRTVTSNPLERFAEKVMFQGGHDQGFAILELDSEVIRLALQIGIDRRTVQLRDAEAIYDRALKQLFKPDSRSFILLNTNEGEWTLQGEPTLVSQTGGSGRLVGVSVSPVMGMQQKDLALLMFEDTVCADDVSYAIQMEMLTTVTTGDGCVPTRTVSYDCKFFFAGEQNPLEMIAAVYRPEVSDIEKASGTFVTIRGESVSGSDILVVAEFALKVLGFILKL